MWAWVKARYHLECRCVLFWFSLGAECDRECGWVIQSDQYLCIALSKKKDLCIARQFRYPATFSFNGMLNLVHILASGAFVIRCKCLIWYPYVSSQISEMSKVFQILTGINTYAWCVYFTAKNTCLVLLLFGSVSLLIRTDAKCSHSHVSSYCWEQIVS